MQQGRENSNASTARKKKRLAAAGLALFIGGAVVHGYELYDWKSEVDAELQRRVSLQDPKSIGAAGEIKRDQGYQKYVQELSNQKEPILFLSSAIAGLGLILLISRGIPGHGTAASPMRNQGHSDPLCRAYSWESSNEKEGMHEARHGADREGRVSRD
jgi:hypothetical protein